MDNNLIVEAIRDTIIADNTEQLNTKKALKARLKYYKAINETLLELLTTVERKLENKVINPFMERDLFRFYSFYIKVFEILLDSTELVKVNESYKSKILKIMEGLNTTDDLETAIEQLNSLK